MILCRLLQLAAAIVFLSSSVEGFAFGQKKSSTTQLPLPTFDETTGRYIKNPADDGQYPYDALGAALRHGPSPFFTRVFNSDEYEQGVLKYMLTQQVDRATATGNTDAKQNNAMDWAYQKMAEEKNGAPVVDYTVLNKKQAALAVIWAVCITPLAIKVITETAGQLSNDPGPCISKAFEGLGICTPL